MYRYCIAFFLAVAGLPALAQDHPLSVDEIGPAVNTSAAAPASEDATGDAAEHSTAQANPDPAYNAVMDELDLDRSEITGNQELPKVLYIVPWQKSDPGDLVGRPVNSLLDEVLAPIDRIEFVRQVRYFEDLQDD